MSRAGGGRAGRHVTPDEAELWSHATSSLARVKAKPRVTAHAADAARAPPRSTGTDPGRAKARSPAPPKASAPPPATTTRRPAPLVTFDRRAFRQVATGKVAIDARLDLHGLPRGDAHARLRAFLLNCRAKGHRMLLVITGKGAETGDRLAGMLARPERGVLRRSVPQWLEEAQFRAIVLGYSTASPRHGGDGALYVRLRKARDD